MARTKQKIKKAIDSPGVEFVMCNRPDGSIQHGDDTPPGVISRKVLQLEVSATPNTTNGKPNIIRIVKKPRQACETAKRVKLSDLPAEMPLSFAAGPTIGGPQDSDVQHLRRERDEWKRKAEKLQVDLELVKVQGREYYNMAKASQNENKRLAAKVDEMQTTFNTYMTELSAHLREGPKEDQ